MRFPLAELLFIKTEDAEYSSQNLAVIYNNGIHSIIFRLEPDMVILFIKCLHCGRIINQCNYDITIVCIITTMDKHLVSIEDSGIDHGVSTDI